MGSKLERHALLPVEVVIPLIQSRSKPEVRTRLLGADFHVNGLRLFTFKNTGLICHCCGITGQYFAIERSPQDLPPHRLVNRDAEIDVPFHLNLYAVNAAGEEILMTHDHIVARSNGGADSPNNTQTMCEPCNSMKGSFEKRYKNMSKIAKAKAIKTLRTKLLQLEKDSQVFLARKMKEYAKKAGHAYFD